MSEFSALPMRAYSWADPDVDLENPRFVVSVEWTWPEGYENGDWTRFSIVRSVRSPVRRREEGQVMMEVIGTDWDHITYDTSENRPVYRDPQPPPGEWVYYTAFVLDSNRVWTFAGTAFEIGIADYDWALRLPETLPGVSIGDMTRTISPAEQSNTLVQFLQNPGALLDRVVTMGEATQYFWDPLRVPPQMLEPMMDSIGYEWDDSLGIDRMRYVLDSLMGPQQGSLDFIHRFVEGASGCTALVTISNNLMLDLNDSSFEEGNLDNTNWAPTTNLEVRDFEIWPDPSPKLHPNVAIGYFLYIGAADTITCGESDPIGRGIPVGTWEKARMGCYAFSDIGALATITLGLKLYDYLGEHLRDVEILSAATTDVWEWYGNEDDSAVSIRGSGFSPSILPSDVLTNPSLWTAYAFGYANPQPAPTSVAEGMEFSWTAPNPADDKKSAFVGVPVSVTVGQTYKISMKVIGGTVTDPDGNPGAQWCLTVGYTTSGLTRTPVEGVEQSAEFLWTATRDDPVFGLEVFRPSDGTWDTAATHIVTEFSVQPVENDPAYAVPYLSVSDACSVDLIVVDDGSYGSSPAVEPPPVESPPSRPDATNTGHNPALLDGTLDGTQYIDIADTVIENKTINGKVVVRAANVTIRNCVLTGGTSANLAEFREPGGVIEDCTLDPLDPTAYVYTAIRGREYTARRNNISRVCDAFGASWTTEPGPLNILIEGNYCHDYYFGPDPAQGDLISHNDGVQIHNNGGVAIRYNTFDMRPTTDPTPTHQKGTTAGLIVTEGDGSDQFDIEFVGNWVGGQAGAAVNIANKAVPTEVDLRDNILDDTLTGHDLSYEFLLNLSADLSAPGMPASTGPDLTNGNVRLSDGSPVIVTRFA